MRCRTPFTTFNRKHHCRKCGDTFCNDCCNKRIPLPSLGLTEPERVCESCYYRVTNPSYNTPPKQSNQNSYADFNNNDIYGNDYISNFERNDPIASKEEEDIKRAIELSLNNNDGNDYISNFERNDPVASKEEEDIKRAIELSLKEAENSYPKPSTTSHNNNRSRTFTADEEPENSEEEEEQLKKAIEASLKDIRISENTNVNNNDSNIAPTNPDELLTTEIENIKLFSQLMEKISAEVPVKGLQAINDTQVQVIYFFFLLLSS